MDCRSICCPAASGLPGGESIASIMSTTASTFLFFEGRWNGHSEDDVVAALIGLAGFEVGLLGGLFLNVVDGCCGLDVGAAVV